MHGINDVGGNQEKGCKEVGRYTILNLNVSSMPVKIREGLCLPLECDQNILDIFATNITQALSKGMVKVLESKYNPNIQFIPEWTRP